MAGQMWSLTLTAESQETLVIPPSALLASLWLFPGLQGALLPQGGHTGPMTIKLNLSKKKKMQRYASQGDAKQSDLHTKVTKTLANQEDKPLRLPPTTTSSHL